MKKPFNKSKKRSTNSQDKVIKAEAKKKNLEQQVAEVKKDYSCTQDEIKYLREEREEEWGKMC